MRKVLCASEIEVWFSNLVLLLRIHVLLWCGSLTVSTLSWSPHELLSVFDDIIHRSRRIACEAVAKLRAHYFNTQYTNWKETWLIRPWLVGVTFPLSSVARFWAMLVRQRPWGGPCASAESGQKLVRLPSNLFELSNVWSARDPACMA